MLLKMPKEFLSIFRLQSISLGQTPVHWNSGITFEIRRHVSSFKARSENATSLLCPCPLG
jgi:hypothetical protein